MDAELQRPQPALLKSVADVEALSEDGSNVTTENVPTYTHRSHFLRPEYNRYSYTVMEFLRFGILWENLVGQRSSFNSILPMRHSVLHLPPSLPIHHKKPKEQSHRQPHAQVSEEAPHPLTEITTRSRLRKSRKRPVFENARSLASKVHESHRQEVLALLDPIVSQNDANCSYVFVCSGSMTKCKILAIKVRDTADEETIWQKIHETWYVARGWWRKLVPLFNVKEIECVKVYHSLP